MEFTTDINNVMYADIDRKKNLPITTLLRAVGTKPTSNPRDIWPGPGNKSNKNQSQKWWAGV
ncbi:MAG: hypothetical protein U5L09_14480 [Bacteroidales bacterium]|nr:hypothetical protein [Bacteroidales bacterium]